MDRCWILLGMMGAGKSAVGRRLAELSGRRFLDTDLLIQARFGRSVSQIFQIYGEAAFRDHETSILRSLEPSESVLATGGGIVLREANWEELRRLGTTVYLKADLNTLCDRLEKSAKKRPLLHSEEWEQRVDTLLVQRLPLYEQADLTIGVDDLSLDEVAALVYDSLMRSGA
jgi:shikimate kinase